MKWKNLGLLVLSTLITSGTNKNLAKTGQTKLQKTLHGELKEFKDYKKHARPAMYFDLTRNGLIDTIVVPFDINSDGVGDVEEYYHAEQEGRTIYWHKDKPYAISFAKLDTPKHKPPEKMWFNDALGPYSKRILLKYLNSHPLDQYDLKIIKQKQNKI